MKKAAFIPNRWVKFLLNGETCIGLTYLYDENDKDEEPLYQLVFLITKRRKSKIINFSECIEIKYLKFVEQQTYSNDLNIDKEYIFPNFNNNNNNNITELAKKQINKISRN